MEKPALPDYAPALVAPRTPLVGRAFDVAEVTRWLDTGERLVTITGATGIGKTRVALEVARTADVTTHVAWAALADVTDVPGLCDAVAGALGLAEEEGAQDPVLRIGRALRTRGDLLLCLDAFDAIAADAEQTAGTWLRMAPELLLVITSRQRTQLPGEVVHELPPLPEASELFVSCAQRIRAGLVLGEQELSLVKEIVQELEGVPLAIELAAARLSVMAPRALLHRIRSGGGGVTDGLTRAFAGAWSSLSDDEKSALSAATVFRGGFTVEAAEAVIDVRASAVDVLMQLRDKSLLFAREEAQDLRLHMYRSVHAFASARLSETPAARAAAESRHAAYFASFATACKGVRDPDTRTRLLAEKDNLLAVIERVTGSSTVTARVAEPALRALLGLAPLLFRHGPLRAYERLVDPAIASTRNSGADPGLLCEVLLTRGALHHHRGAAAKGSRDLVHALGIARTLEQRRLEARALFELGHALADAGDAALAEDHFRRAAALFAAEREPLEEGRAHASLAAIVARAGRTEEARSLLARAQEAHADDAEARAEDLLFLGALELGEGKLAAARAATEQSLSLCTDSRRAAARARMQLGIVARRAGDRALARSMLERAAEDLALLGFEGLAAEAQGQLGIVAREDGKIAEAKTRLGAACDALHELARGDAAQLFAEHLRALSSADATPKAPPEDALLVADDGAWFRPSNGTRVGLERRRPLARITERLTKERLERPGSPLGTRALVDAAWAGEKLQASAGAHRVRVAISTLRKLGLPIVTREDGYALDPEISLLRA